MGIWSEKIEPRLATAMLDNKEMRTTRAEVVPAIHGDVLEIGWGSGLNVPYYPGGVECVHAVEPSATYKHLGEKRAAASTVRIDFAGDDAQAIPLDDATMDTALSTFVLCTIPDAPRALREVFRVLRPGGTFHFAEHGLAPDPKIARWQRRLTPLQRRLFGGCTLDRPITDLLKDAGFEVAVRNQFMPGPALGKPWGYQYIGQATKPAA